MRLISLNWIILRLVGIMRLSRVGSIMRIRIVLFSFLIIRCLRMILVICMRRYCLLSKEVHYIIILRLRPYKKSNEKITLQFLTPPNPLTLRHQNLRKGQPNLSNPVRQLNQQTTHPMHKTLYNKSTSHLRIHNLTVIEKCLYC